MCSFSSVDFYKVFFIFFSNTYTQIILSSLFCAVPSLFYESAIIKMNWDEQISTLYGARKYDEMLIHQQPSSSIKSIKAKEGKIVVQSWKRETDAVLNDSNGISIYRPIFKLSHSSLAIKCSHLFSISTNVVVCAYRHSERTKVFHSLSIVFFHFHRAYHQSLSLNHLNFLLLFCFIEFRKQQTISVR